MKESLAIDGGPPVRTKAFPAWPIYDHREEEALLAVLHSGHWGILTGDRVKMFEERFATYQGARFGLCLPNGTQALELALRALGVGSGDEVITSPYTFIATASSILMAGAVPIFADIEAQSYTIDPAKVEEAITTKTKAIVPVHIGGRPADMAAIMEIARRHSLYVLEDACQAWGAEWRGQRVGAIGDLGAFSFQASKNITAGEGGMVVTSNPELYETCWSLHNVGRIRAGAWYQHEHLGFNMRMTEWQGAILLAQLERLPEQTRKRAANADYLIQALGEGEGLAPLPPDPRVTQHAWHLFMMRYNPAAFGGRPRDQFLAALRAEGITPCSSGYLEPLHQSRAIRQAISKNNRLRFAQDPGDFETSLSTLPACPVAEQAVQETIWLPQFVLLGDRSDMDEIVAAVRKIQRAWQ